MSGVPPAAPEAGRLRCERVNGRPLLEGAASMAKAEKYYLRSPTKLVAEHRNRATDAKRQTAPLRTVSGERRAKR